MNDKEGWIPIRPGVSRKSLAVNPELGVQMDVIKLEPNFTDRAHIHDGFEWVYVLEGSFEDERGIHVKGEFLLNNTKGVHQPSTGSDGCTLLIVWTGSVSKLS